MNKRFCVLTMLVALALVASSAVAQDHDTLPARPLYGHIPAHPSTDNKAPATSLQTWAGTFTYQGTTNHFTMVGTDPSSTNTTTTIPVFVVPVRLGYKGSNGSKTIFDPTTAKLPNGQTVLQNVLASPIFNSGVDFVQGGTDVGNTQYIDAYQRGNFWTNVMTNTNYHVLLGTPTVLATRTLVVPAADGKVGTEFGVTVGLADINWFDTQANAVIKHYTQIQPNSLVIFVTYDAYLTEFGSCCIGGYHNATGSQTYSHFTYIDHVGVFSQDVSALSHEIGEWMDDPLVNNTQGACGGLLENGDPLEGEANYGGYPYVFNGFTYNLQDLVFLKYFGQTPATSVNGWDTFQGTTLSVCQNGQ
jgi:hypothetical protein